MSGATTLANNTSISFWRKSLNWIQAFEEALDYDPAQASIDRLNRQVTELQNTVHNLESQLGEHGDEIRHQFSKRATISHR